MREHGFKAYRLGQRGLSPADHLQQPRACTRERMPGFELTAERDFQSASDALGFPHFPIARRAEDRLEGGAQRGIHLGHGNAAAEIVEACQAEMRIGDAAGHDAVVVRKIRRDVEGDAVEADPASHAYADRGDLVLCRSTADAARLVVADHPDADAILAPFALHREGG